jgi:hypothetical protein
VNSSRIDSETNILISESRKYMNITRNDKWSKIISSYLGNYPSKREELKIIKNLLLNSSSIHDFFFIDIGFLYCLENLNFSFGQVDFPFK